MPTGLPIGFSDFGQLRREGLLYVDKTGLVTDVIRSLRQVVLLPRPRRFGKTMNLTMLRSFFERGGDGQGLFDGLSVMDEGPDVLEHFQRHPVIFLTFKDVKQPGWEGCLKAIQLIVGDEIGRHEPTWSAVSGVAAARLAELMAGASAPTSWASALRWLSEALATATGEGVVILIDEYDTPIHAGFTHGYYEPAVSFFRNFLSAGMKDNRYLFRGVITGILRVAKESIFSGLNNVDVHTMLSPQFATHFGFLEPEVAALCSASGQPEALDLLRAWYNGYRMGSAVIYNPWSVLSQLARPGSPPQAWWVNTASDDILRELLISAGLGVQDDLSALIRGEVMQRPVSEEIVLRDVRLSASALWSFLLFSGYLTLVDPLSRDQDGQVNSALRIPNREVAVLYRTLFQRWLDRCLPVWSDAPRRLAQALLSGDAETFEALLSRLMLEALSSHDLGGRQPEAVYQAFVVGLLVQLEATHDVRSNRESGFGRYDVLIRPRRAGEPGAVLELKVLRADRGETPEQGLERAMKQVQDRDYAAELRAAGASPAWQWGAVFDGKRAWVEVAPG